MKRVFLLLFVAIITFLIVVFFKNPGFLDDIWMWLVGLAGLIIKGGKSIINYFSSLFDKLSTDDQDNPDSIREGKSIPSTTHTKQVDPSKIQMRIVRYQDDGQTTLGLLYINNKFYCYTLEDTWQKVKVPGKTRIPAGAYPVKFRKEESELTNTYRSRYSEWFSYHLQIQHVPGFRYIYIHNGGDHTKTEGCILVSDSLNTAKRNTYLSNSKETFKRLYGFLEMQIKEGKKITLTIDDENWMSKMSVN